MLFTILVSAVLIGLDQLTKMFARANLAQGGAVTVIPGIIEFRYHENDGAAFSILSGNQTFLIIITSLALLVVAYILLFRKPKIKLEYYALLLIFSGGVGNLIDRIANRFVVDFISPLFINFAVFNVADIFVTVGFAILLVTVICTEIKASKQKKLTEAQGSATASASDVDEKDDAND